MLLLNRHPDYRAALAPADAATLGLEGATEAERYLVHRDNHAETPLHPLPALAAALGHAVDPSDVLGGGVGGRRLEEQPVQAEPAVLRVEEGMPDQQADRL